MSTFRLTSLSPDSGAGGCSCKVPSDILSEIVPLPGAHTDALVTSSEHLEDAAVWRDNAGNLLVATTDFFTPIVDDPYDFGCIAGANALSDIYAMGAKPMCALNILACPDNVPPDATKKILEGGAAACAMAGIPIGGGHSIHLSQFVYGLAVIGQVSEENLKRNHTARDGDALILSKPLGSGILSATHRRGKGDDKAYAEMLHWMTKLNDIGVRLGENPSVHALTDVSGFGLLGHLNEMCRGAQLAVDLRVADVPVMHALTHLFEQLINGPRTNAAKDKNNDRLIDKPSGSAQRALKNIKLQGAKSLPPWQLNTLTDPQTSGGLLIACSAGAAGEIVSLLHTQGFERAQVIGQFRAGDAIHIHA